VKRSKYKRWNRRARSRAENDKSPILKAKSSLASLCVQGKDINSDHRNVSDSLMFLRKETKKRMLMVRQACYIIHSVA